jgi:hypothetical protein
MKVSGIGHVLWYPTVFTSGLTFEAKTKCPYEVMCTSIILYKLVTFVNKHMPLPYSDLSQLPPVGDIMNKL